MYSELCRYLVLNKQLSLPGIGQFSVERQPAVSDFLNKKIDPPTYSIVLRRSNQSPSMQFYTWLGEELQVPGREAVIRFNDFVFELKKQVISGAVITWKGIGVLSKDIGGDIRLEASPPLTMETSVPAERLVREKAEHFIMVGERERTSTEMTAFLNPGKPKKISWWLVPLLAGLLMIFFIGWHFFQQGCQVSSLANQQQAKASP